MWNAQTKIPHQSFIKQNFQLRFTKKKFLREHQLTYQPHIITKENTRNQPMNEKITIPLAGMAQCIRIWE